MHAGQNTKMKPGAVRACVITVGVGSIISSILLIGPLQRLLSYEFDWPSILFVGRYYASFAFVPPLAIPLAMWAACRSLAKIESLDVITRWRSAAGRIVLAAVIFHFLLVALFEYLNYLASPNKDLLEIEPIIVSWMFKSLIRWLFITLPLSLICATIFWRVTKFPEDVSVF